MPDKKILFSAPAFCFPENILQEMEQAQRPKKKRGRLFLF